MKRFKLVTGVILVFAVGFLAGAFCVEYYYNKRIEQFIAGGPPMDARVRMLLDEFSKDLELTDTQRVEIEKILRNAQEQISDLRRKTFPQIEEINEKSLDLIREQLNDKQRDKFNTFYNKMKRFHDRFAVRLDFPGRSFSPDMNDMKTRLNLTPDQVDEIEKIMKNIFKKREEIMEESRKKGPPDFSKIRQEMMELFNQEREKIEKLLNEEQLEAFKKFIEERRFRGPPGRGRGPWPSSGPGGPPPPDGAEGPPPNNPERNNRSDDPLPPANW